MVMDMVSAAIAGRDEYYTQQPPAEYVQERPRTVLPPINDKQVIGDGGDEMIDR